MNPIYCNWAFWTAPLAAGSLRPWPISTWASLSIRTKTSNPAFCKNRRASMKEQPVLTTERLILLPYSLSDAKELQRLIGDRDVSDTLQLVPYPYLDGMAEEWINQQINTQPDNKNTHYSKDIHFAITNRESGFLMGTFSIMNISKITDKAEI